ncbi:MAG: sulfite exporter TauE/SafE family protein [Bacteroidia bacterium]|nr:sulfite exporter TauE/SafE family protein [Bacteroidia bacterium]
MEYLVVCIVALIGSALTLFSGFGLGTILLPVFGLFFPIPVAVALTAVVHFLNNIFKLFLLGKQAHWPTVLRFGLPSVVAALVGAILLSSLSSLFEICEYQLFGKFFYVTPVKLVIGLLLILFSLFEIVPALANLKFDRKYLPLGGLLSGFFGGLSGNQGALRSAFLIRAGLAKEQYIATGVVIACMIDLTRLSVYYQQIFSGEYLSNLPLLVCAVLAAFIGAYAGTRLIKKITIESLQKIVAGALILFGILLGAGII